MYRANRKEERGREKRIGQDENGKADERKIATGSETEGEERGSQRYTACSEAENERASGASRASVIEETARDAPRQEAMLNPRSGPLSRSATEKSDRSLLVVLHGTN